MRHLSKRSKLQAPAIVTAILNEETRMHSGSSARTARVSRRQMLYALSIGGAATAVDWNIPAYAQQAVSGATTPPLAALNRFPRMVQEFFVARENALHEQRLERLAALKTKADAEAYVRAVREKV